MGSCCSCLFGTGSSSEYTPINATNNLDSARLRGIERNRNDYEMICQEAARNFLSSKAILKNEKQSRPLTSIRSDVTADASLLQSPVVHRPSSTSSGNSPSGSSSNSSSSSSRVGALLGEQPPSINGSQFRSVLDSSQRKVSNLTQAAPFIVSFQS